MLKRTGTVGAVLATTSLLLSGVAVGHQQSRLVDDGVIDSGKETHAHDVHQQGAAEGHIDPRDYDVEVVSKLGLKNADAGKFADVGVHKGYAYVAAWGGQTCKYNGVHVVDVRAPEAPREVAFVPSKEGSYPGEGVQALSVSTPAYTGELLVTNNETCKSPAGFGGLNIYDVTNAARPVPLAIGYGDDSAGSAGVVNKNAHQIHSVFAWDAGDKAYAVIVDNEEGKDVDIVDITNPKKPFLAAEYDLDVSFPQIRQPGLDDVFHHDVVVKKIGRAFVMLVSYWDGGYVQLDVTDPRSARYIGDTDYPAVDALAPGGVRPEGNAHQAEFTADNRFVVAADEDFSPYALLGRNTADGTDIQAGQGSETAPLKEGAAISGQSVFVGRGCTGDPVPSAGAGTQIAVVERGLCTFTEKVASVEAAGGYEAVLVFNRTGTDACENGLGMDVAGNIPTFGVAPRSQGFALFDQPYDKAACEAGTQVFPVPVGTPGDEVTFSSYFDGWGYVRLYERGPGKMTELDAYGIPEAHDPTKATGFGDLSVHEVATSAVDPALAYLSYYAGGLRVLKITEGKRPELTEVGAFTESGGNDFWGVEAFSSGGTEYVAASDRDKGLYIFRYTGR